MQIEDNLTLLNSILDNGGSILIPSDGVWGISCKATDAHAVKRLTSEVATHTNCFQEVLVSDIPMLKRYAEEIHPRVETLLSFHERPVRIMCPQSIMQEEGVYMRIVKDTVSRILLNELGYPLYFISFLAPDDLSHLTLASIKSKEIPAVQFIASNRPDEEEDLLPVPLLRIEYDKDGMIKVLK